MDAQDEQFGISPLNGRTADMLQTEATFLCADVVSFTAMTQRLGDFRSIRLMRRVARLVQAEVARREGRILEVRGDSFLVTLPNPDGAIACARTIHRVLERDSLRHPDGGVEVRIAIHTGPVLQIHESYFGLNLILAYRLFPMLRAGQTGVSEAALSASSSPPVTDRRNFRPKGFRDAVSYGVFETARGSFEPSVAATDFQSPLRSESWSSTSREGLRNSSMTAEVS